MNYDKKILSAIKSFWDTKKKQGNVLAGKQLDAFLDEQSHRGVFRII